MNEVYLRYLEVAKRLTGSSDIDTLIDAATKIATAMSSQQWGLIENYVETGQVAGSFSDFITTCRIQHPSQGSIPFILYPFQSDLANLFVTTEQKLILINSARQMGMTTLLAAYALYRALSAPDRTIVLLTNKFSGACEMLDRVYYMADGMVLPLSFTHRSKSELRFDNGSRVLARAATSDSLRGVTISDLIVTDAAFLPYGRDTELWQSMLPALSTGAKCIIQTTPKEPRGLFFNLWADHRNVAAERVTIPWTAHPSRDEEWARSYRDQLGEARFRQEFECEFIMRTQD